VAALAFAWLAACEDTPALAPTPSCVDHAAAEPRTCRPAPAAFAARAPAWADRTKQATFDRGLARLAALRTVLLSPELSPARASELGFECASLRSDQKALATERDPLVSRFIADVDKTCGLDVPLAAAYSELRAVDAKRSSGASVKGECLGLRMAIGDFAPQYTSNPAVTQVGGRYATLCHTE
jgi:hypothetical protein